MPTTTTTQTPPVEAAVTTTDLPRDFATAMDMLRSALPGWEPRQPQVDLATSIEDWMALPSNVHVADGGEPSALFAQAPTGTGKSLAYLIPAIQSGKRVVVSVTTKALQDQLSGTDLPFLGQHLGHFTWAVLKGRSSYLCQNRLRDADEADVPNKAAILAYLASEPEGFDGTRDSLPNPVLDREWMNICSETEECGSCDAETCYAQRARVTARQARIIVVNHALLFTDLLIRQISNGVATMLGDFDMVICDEGHEIREVATSSQAAEITEGTFRSLVGNVRTWVSRYGSEAAEEAVLGHLDTLLMGSVEMFRALPGETQQTSRLHLADIERCAEEIIDVIDSLNKIGAALSKATLAPNMTPEMVERATARRRSLGSRISNARGRMTSVLTDQFEDTVRWVELRRNWRGEQVKSLKASPVDIAPWLREVLFSQAPVLVISATLAVGGKFNYIATQLGAENWEGKIVGSPFDFQTQARLYVAGRLPMPTGRTASEWESAANIEIMELVRAAQGRTLILFTSIAHMRRARTFLSEAMDFPVKMQGDPGESTESLKRWFMEDVEGVLLGTRSFFTGFDPRGESCSQVIIVKFPFPVPTDPMVQARGEAVEARGGKPFFDLMLPETSLVVQQMAGRAVRHTTDRAVIAVLDPRAATKPYGQGLMRDLGPIPRANTRQDVAEFLAQSREHFQALRDGEGQ